MGAETFIMTEVWDYIHRMRRAEEALERTVERAPYDHEATSRHLANMRYYQCLAFEALEFL